MMATRSLAAVLSLLVFPIGPIKANEATDAAWAALARGGHVALMRHATAPGTGDPAGFRLDDCTTQRNLSEDGRAEARAVGAAFRSRGITVDAVYSSAWCRCLETARLLDLAPVSVLPALNSFFQQQDQRNAQTAALRAWLAANSRAGAVVLVTHQVNITALTGIIPRSGEIVVAYADEQGHVSVIGLIPPP